MAGTPHDWVFRRLDKRIEMNTRQFRGSTAELQETLSPSVRVDGDFPIDFADKIARLESYNKHLYRPNTYLHKWWARRCGSTFRIILKQLVDDPASRDYYHPGGLEGKIILDPMIGGGTTLHEAIRLGANVIGADIDPIPILQARATLSAIPLQHLQTAFESFFENLRGRLAPSFATACPDCGKITEAMFTLYGRRQECSCGTSLAIDATVLRTESDGSRFEICDQCGEVHKATGQGTEHSCRQRLIPFPIREKRNRRCPECDDAFRQLGRIPFYARFTPIAVVGRCQHHGLFFKSPSSSDLDPIRDADETRGNLPLTPLSDFAVQPGPKSRDLVKHGINSYLDLFSSRQLVYLSHAIVSLSEADGLIGLNLGLLVSTSTEFNSMLCGYKGGGRRRPGAIRHTFAHHAYSFPYTALENNPVYPHKTSGSLQALFHSRIHKARTWAGLPTERLIKHGKVKQKTAIRGEVDEGQEVSGPDELLEGTRRFLLIQGSSIELDLPSQSVDHVVTDPPYFDNVQYGDLSAFFRVWLKRLLPREAAWDYDLGDSAVDPHTAGNGQYESTLGGIFRECRRVLKKEGRLIFTFHHWNPKGWAALTSALGSAAFTLVNRYIIHSENPASVHVANLRALQHDAVLVLGSTLDNEQVWTLPERVDSSCSETFIRDCADALGWMLSSELRRTEIMKLWMELLR